MTLAAPSLRTLLGGKSLFHGGVRQPFAAELNRVALGRHKTAAPEEILRAVTHVSGQAGRAARGCEFFQRIDEHVADPLSSGRRMDVEHVDAVRAGERCEADGRAVDRAKQGQRVGEPRGESLLVVRARRPSLLLVFAVVFASEFRDAGAKYFREQRRIRRQKRSQRRFPLCLRRHGAMSQVVTNSPVFGSFLSFNTTPFLASSSRIRSASPKSFDFRAAARNSIRAFTVSPRARSGSVLMPNISA